ncbi:TPA: hypothetical protein ACGIK9_003278 [Acinetobacter baumannii]|uniref:hypothetical protein n=1 Tax=Acinetobacter baumannii TaxID=470 RepID=UPI00338D6F2C
MQLNNLLCSAFTHCLSISKRTYRLLIDSATNEFEVGMPRYTVQLYAVKPFHSDSIDSLSVGYTATYKSAKNQYYYEHSDFVDFDIFDYEKIVEKYQSLIGDREVFNAEIDSFVKNIALEIQKQILMSAREKEAIADQEYEVIEQWINSYSTHHVSSSANFKLLEEVASLADDHNVIHASNFIAYDISMYIANYLRHYLINAV